jgi:hypothetical protein
VNYMSNGRPIVLSLIIAALCYQRTLQTACIGFCQLTSEMRDGVYASCSIYGNAVPRDFVHPLRATDDEWPETLRYDRLLYLFIACNGLCGTPIF